MPLSTSIVAAALLAASPAAAPKPEPWPAGPVRDRALVELGLLVPDHAAARRTVELIRRLAPVHAKGFRVAISPEKGHLPRPPAIVVGSSPAEPFDADYLRVTAFGLDDAARARLLRGLPRVSLLVASPAASAHQALRAAVAFAAEAARREHAFVTDPDARLTYAPDTFLREVAEGGFDGAALNVSAHVNLHTYAWGHGDGPQRTVTVGMSKLGLPDVAVNGHTRGEAARVVALVSAVCQRLDDAPEVDRDGTIAVDLDQLASPRARKEQLAFQQPGARSRARVGLSVSSPDEGDADNRLAELTFPGIGTATERQHALLVTLYGPESPKPIMRRADDPELRAASDRARAELRDLKAPFQRGFPAGTELQVKAPFVREGRREYLWIEVTAWDGGKVRGILRSEPKIAVDLRSGAAVAVDEVEVFDYLLRRPDGTEVGNYTTAVLRRAREQAP